MPLIALPLTLHCRSTNLGRFQLAWQGSAPEAKGWQYWGSYRPNPNSLIGKDSTWEEPAKKTRGRSVPEGLSLWEKWATVPDQGFSVTAEKLCPKEEASLNDRQLHHATWGDGLCLRECREKFTPQDIVKNNGGFGGKQLITWGLVASWY